MADGVGLQPVEHFLRRQLFSLACGALLIAIGFMLSLAVLFPQDTLSAFSIPEDDGFFPFIIVITVLAGGCFLTAGWWIMGWIFRHMTGFRRFGAATQATVATEFLLALPVLMYLFGTVFQMGEIAHAQLVFRYAAFSAARAGTASNNLIPWPPRIESQSGSALPMIYFISDDDKARMRAAAAVALSGIDGHKFTDRATGIADLSHEGLAYHYYQAGEAALVRKSNRNPWVDRTSFFGRQLRDANAALVKFEPQCEYSKLFPGNLASTISNQINQLLNLDSISADSGGALGSLLSAIGINPQDMIMGVLNSIISSILDGTGLGDILKSVPNPLAPPMISVNMKYEMRLRPASLFWLISPKGVGGYPCLSLQRTGHYKNSTALLMQTTGSRVDMPVVPPVILYVNLFPGESKTR